jgi:ribosomal protein L29
LLLDQIQEIEADVKTSDKEKFSQIKKIREEIAKVGTEIDNLKSDIMILNTHRVN